MRKKRNLTILVDSREQLPYIFHGYPCGIKIIGLKTGDYTIEGYEDEICVERKSKEDLYSSFGNGRTRFEKEFIRMSAYKYSALVIESSLKDLLSPPEYSKMNSRSIIQSILSWSIKYHVFVYFADNRKLAECLVYSLFDKFLYNKEKVRKNDRKKLQTHR